MPFSFSNMFKSDQPKKRITVSTLVGVTEAGKREVSKYTSGGTTFDVIAPLDDRSPQTVRSLMNGTGYTYEQIAPILEQLEKQKYIEIFGEK